jgi:nucleoside 2-deoxyribosyltransferase
MIITIHASLDFKDNMVEAKRYLEKNGFEVILPELTRYQHIRDDLGDDAAFTRIKNKMTKENMANVKRCDYLLILNYPHRGYSNYVGGNSFLEMAVAFYLKKPIYLLNEIPLNLPYTEEIRALEPIIVRSIDNFVHIIWENMDAKT